jgi:N-acetylglutamate synthase-like GNAT family acetyltransferase
VPRHTCDPRTPTKPTRSPAWHCAKATWGHDSAFLERARTQLTLTPSDVQRLVIRVAERDGQAVGFSALDLDAAPLELTMLFVEPSAMRTGVGHTLLRAALADARARDITHLLIENDPDAEPFYRKHGAHRIGTRTSPSTGRSLPLLRLPTRD